MEDTIHVKMSFLNNLLEQTGEVIITGTRLNILEKEIEESYIKQVPVSKTILNMIKQISITSRQTAEELHKTVMNIRQVEFKDTILSLQRLVRELAKDQGKKIKFHSEGGETLVDKAIVEELHGALLHLIRNAVDHGIELPSDRKLKNKPEEGNIYIKIYKKDRFVYLEISDDGAGIDCEKVCKKALEKGLVTPEQVEKLSESEKYEFIFLPGFSTRDTITEISGRGVGMDVVKTSVEKLKGTISIESKLGFGTKFLFKIPIISAVNIVDALMIDVDNIIYAIPISMVVATMSVKPEDLNTVSGQITILFRNKVLPIYDLASLLNLSFCGMEATDTKNIVVIRERDEMIGIRVSKFLPPQKVVIKMLDNYFGKVRGILGTTLLSSDNIGLIIDVPELINIALKRETNLSQTTNVYSENIGKSSIDLTLKSEVKLTETKVKPKEKKLKVDIDSDIDLKTKMEIALNYEGKLLDAYNLGIPIYEIDLMLESDIIKATKKRIDIYKNIKQCGELLCIVPMTSSIPDNIKDFIPENFDFKIKFFIISNLNINDISNKLSIPLKNIRTVGINIVEEVEVNETESIFTEVELIEDYETFANDTQKNINSIAAAVLQLEENPSNKEAINEIFRAFHTIKSSTAMLGIKNMSEIAHDIETILDRIRNDLDVITTEKVDLLFKVLKFFEECMKAISVGMKPVLSNTELKNEILKFKDEMPSKKLIRVVDIKQEKFIITSFEKLVIDEKKSKGMKLYEILVEFVPDLPMKMVNAFLLFKNLKEYGEIVKTIPTMEEIDQGNFELYFKILFITDKSIEQFEQPLKTDEIKNFEIKLFNE